MSCFECWEEVWSMNRKNIVFAAYCVADAIGDITPEQARHLTHLNIAFGVVKDNLINVDSFRRNRYYIRAGQAV